jgi:hypothetical protein
MKNPKTVTKEDIERRNAEFDSREWRLPPGAAAFVDERKTEINTFTPGKPDITTENRIVSLEFAVDALLERVERLEDIINELCRLGLSKPSSPDIKWPTAAEYQEAIFDHGLNNIFDKTADWFRSQIEPQLKGDK